MDKQTAEKVFTEQILNRWPDFELNKVQSDDWVRFLQKYSEESIVWALQMYVGKPKSLKEANRAPEIWRIKELLGTRPDSMKIEMPEENKYPMYFVRTTTGGNSGYKQPYSFARIIPTSFIPDNAMRQVQHCKKEYERLYGGEWEVTICENRADFSLMLEQRKNHSFQAQRK